MNQLKAGAVLSYLSIIVTIIIALIYTPIMIRLLGQPEYGLYSMIGSFVGYLSILDMGLGNAIVRYIALNRALGNKEEESKLNGMFMILYSILGLLTFVVGTILYQYIDQFFGATLTMEELNKGKIMALLLIINFAVSFPLGVFSSIMQAYERFIVIKSISIARSLLIPCTTLPFLFMGYGSVSMVLISTILNIATLLYGVYYCYKNLRIHFYFGKFNYGLLKEIAGYSFFIFLAVVVDKVYWSTDQFILGVVSGTVSVAVYAVAMQFINLYMLFSTSISGVFLPKISMMVANDASPDELTEIMIKIGRLQYMILAYILGGFVLFGQAFIRIWAGSDYNEAFYITVVVMVPLTIPLIQSVGIPILQAKNLHGFRSTILLFIATFNVVISIPLAKSYGGIGSAAATAVSLIIGNIILMNIYYHRKIGLNIPLFWKNIMYLSLPLSIVVAMGYALNYLLPIEGIFVLLIKITLFSMVYLGVMWAFALNHFEKHTFSSMFSRVAKVFKIGGMMKSFRRS